MAIAKSLTLAPMETISVNAASREFGIPPSTISGWHRDGLIRIVERRGQAVLMLRSDVVTLAANYRPGAGRGKRAKLARTLLAS